MLGIPVRLRDARSRSYYARPDQKKVGTDDDSDSAQYFYILTSVRYVAFEKNKPTVQNSSVIITYSTRPHMADGRVKLKLALWLGYSGQRGQEEMRCHYV